MGGMPRIRLDLAYDGTFFSGWAAQPGLRTVEGELGRALAAVVRHPVRLTVAGRTDAGVHAAAQTAHVDVDEAAWLALPGRSQRPSGRALRERLTGVLARQAGEAADCGRIGPLPRGAADVVVQTSLWEGQPIVVQEALRAGAAIVATDVGGTAQTARGGAVLVEPRAEALAGAVAALLGDPGALAGARHRSAAAGARLPDEGDLRDQLRRVVAAPPSGAVR